MTRLLKYDKVMPTAVPHGGHSMTRLLKTSIVLGIWVLYMDPAAHAGVISFDPAGSIDTLPMGLNAKGSIAGRYDDPDGNIHGFLRARNGTITTFDASDPVAQQTPGAVPCWTYATGINSKNTVVGYQDGGCPLQGFIRASDGTITLFSVDGSTGLWPAVINSKGVVAGTYFDGMNHSHGYVRKPNGSIQKFDPFESTSTGTQCINESGVVSGYYVDSGSVFHGYIRTHDGTITTFDVPNASQTVPTCLNDLGDVVGYYYDNNQTTHGFLRAADGTFTTIDVPRAEQTIAWAINNDGIIVGTFSLDLNSNHGFVRSANGTLKRFDPKGSVETRPVLINDKGTIAGSYFDTDGQQQRQHGFVRKP